MAARTFAACFALCLLSAPAFAQNAASAPKPPAELAQLRELLQVGLGLVRCKGTVFASSFGPEHPTIIMMVARPDLDGFWLTQHSNELKTAENPNPAKFLQAVGYDTAKKKFIAIGQDNLGGHWLEWSDSVAPDKAVFVGTFTLNGNDINIRDTLTPGGHMGEIQVGGVWNKFDEETCAMNGMKKPPQ